MARPKIKIKKTKLDQWLEMLAIAALIVLFIYPAINYSTLPDQIPIHFNENGNPDAYNSKGMIWILPIIGLVLYLLLSWIQTIYHKFNYAVKITEENAEHQYSIAVKMILILKTIILMAFAYLAWSSVQIALGKTSGLGIAFLPIFLIAIFGTIGYGLYSSFKKS